MNQLLSSLGRNRRFQDFMGVARGAYKILDGAITQRSGTMVNSDKIQVPKAEDLMKPECKGVYQEKYTKLNENSDLSLKQNVSGNNQPFSNSNIEFAEKSPTIVTKESQHVKEQSNINISDSQSEVQIKTKKSEVLQNKPIRSEYEKSVQYLKKGKYEHLENFRKEMKYQVEESPIPSSSFSRAFEFGKLGFSLAGEALTSFVKTKIGLEDPKQSHLLTQKNAKRITNALCKMRGAPLKLAQALSIQQDKLIPKQIRLAFQRARDEAHIIPQSEISVIMGKNFGNDYYEKYFQSFSTKPFAACSIGQVHEGVLKNGQRVAIKIQYPNVAESVDSDLKNLQRVMNYTGFFPKNLFMDRIIENTRNELHEECDYIIEREKQLKYREMLKNDPRYYVPKIIDELSTKEVLTGEYVDGLSMNELEEFPQPIRDEIATRVMELTFKQLFYYKFMQTDPNPSNFSYNIHTDQLNLLDFGAARSYKDSFIDYYWQVIQGSVEQNDDLIWQASIKMGFVTGQENNDMKKAHIASIKIIGDPLRYKGEFDFGSQSITARIYETVPIMLKNRLRPPPLEVYSLHRKLSGSYLLCIRLKAKVNCHNIYRKLESQYEINPLFKI